MQGNPKFGQSPLSKSFPVVVKFYPQLSGPVLAKLKAYNFAADELN